MRLVNAWDRDCKPPKPTDVAGGVKSQPNAGSPTKVGEAHSMGVEDEIINCIALSAKEAMNPLNT